MNDDLEYVNSLEKELDELESEKADFSNIYDLLLEECVSKDVICSYLHSLSDLNAYTELQCLYLHKVKECECLAQKLSKQTESVNKEDLKAQMQDKNIAISELKKLIETFKRKGVDTNFEQPSILGKPPVQSIRNQPVIVQLILFIVDSRCTKHMMGNLKLLCNFLEKFLGTVRFGNDQFAPILGYGDLNQGNVMIKRVYYVEGLNHNLFSVGQFYDVDLEVAFKNLLVVVRDLKGNDFTNCVTWIRYLCNISQEKLHQLQSVPWLKLHQSCPRINFVHLVKSVSKRSSFKSKALFQVSKGRYTWTLFLRSKDETPEVLKDFLTMIQRNLQAQVISVQCVVEKTDNRTLVEAARTMLSASKLPLSFWAEASKGYHVYNKRTRLIVESIHIKFDEIKEMMSDHNSSDLAPQRQEIQNVVPTAEKTDSSQQGLEFLFSPLLEEYYNQTTVMPEDTTIDQAPKHSFYED
ncbi:hypothetical protein Tco_0200847 [Tanacetum coccineum]